LQGNTFQLGMRNDTVHGAHREHLLGAVLPPQEEDLASELLADHSGQVRGSIAGVEASDIGVGLLEPRVFGTREGEIADDVQGMASARRPAGYDGDHDLRHEPDESLDLEDVQAAGPTRLHRVRPAVLRRRRVLVAVATTDALVATRTERPAAVLGGRPVPGEQHAADVAGHPGMIQRPV